jgi:hypothetical protein
MTDSPTYARVIRFGSAHDILAGLFPFIIAALAYLPLAVVTLYKLVANFSSAIPGIAGQHADFAQFYLN